MDLLKVKSPGEIFSGDINTLKSEFDKLARKYHPDINKSSFANDEFIHLQGLYERAKEELKGDFWETKDTLRFNSYRVKFIRKMELPIGKMYVGNSHVTFMIEKKYKNLFDNAVNIINGFKYSSDKMKNEMSKYLPSIKVATELSNYCVLVLNKTPDLILLRDIPIYSLPDKDKHIAWIISSLYNTMCYLEYAGIVHNAISLDTYFISPKYHSGALLGGWWYSCKQGNKLLAVPRGAYDLLSPFMKKTRIADHSLDKELLRSLGRELLGDRTGTRLLLDKSAPLPLINWLKCATSKTIIKEYALWDKVLEESYGKKKFISMNVTIKSIYGGK